MEASLAYLEAMAFSHGHQAMLVGLKLTRIAAHFSNAANTDASLRSETLKNMDEAYAILRQQVTELK